MKNDKSKQGFIDEDIIHLIEKLNSSGFQTTSSCSGRIVLLDIPRFGDKQKANWVYKSHNEVDPENVLKISKGKNCELYFLQEPPIIHIKCKTKEKALKILELAFRAGFKRSSVLTLKNYLVEIKSSERLETPLLYSSDEFLKNLAMEANSKLIEGKTKLKKLMNLLG